MNKKTNYWEIISQYTIEIPIIQRDYAQGRNSYNIQNIRNKIIKNIYRSLKENKELEFDFIYGNIEERKDSAVFIPLDGQQRLTTLFLVYFYNALINKEPIDYKRLENFSYETRASSREFCKALISNMESLSLIESEKEISEVIKNKSWFFKSWQKDPTIKSMLVMLDCIHEVFKDDDSFWELLTSENCPIIFRFIRLENFGLKDDLYIKMNARGKQLTKFENFKAKFEQYILNNFPDIIKDVRVKIDTNWTDLFWSIENNLKFDNLYFNYFQNTFINNYFSRSDNNLKSIRHADFSIEEMVRKFDSTMIRDIYALDSINLLNLEELSFKKINPKIVFENFIGNYLNYETRLFFYSISRFLTVNKEYSAEKFSEWLRVVYNLVKNTDYDEALDFSKSIKAINKLVVHSDNILEFLASNEIGSGFSSIQTEEEQLKAQLIIRGEKWKELILSAENHGYFDGQIKFLFLYSGILEEFRKNNLSKWSNKEDEIYFNKFMSYYNKSNKVFTDDGITFNEYTFERALLCKGEYWLGKGQKVNFLQNKHRDYSWKRLLRDFDNTSEKSWLIKSLLDSIGDSKSIIEELNEIIKYSIIRDSRKYFIQNPKLIDICGKGFIQKYENTYLLLNKTITAGYHKELRSYNLFLILVDKYNCDPNTTKYSEQLGVSSKKSISTINNINLDISFSSNGFVVDIDDTLKYISDELSVINYLQEKNVI